MTEKATLQGSRSELSAKLAVEDRGDEVLCRKCRKVGHGYTVKSIPELGFLDWLCDADLKKLEAALEAKSPNEKEAVEELREKIRERWVELKVKRDKIGLKMATNYPSSSGINKDLADVDHTLLTQMTELKWVLKILAPKKASEETV